MRKLTQKQQKFVKEVVATLNPTEAVRRTYDLGSKNGKDIELTARSIASENLTKPNIQKSIVEEMNSQGITREERVKKLKELFNSGDTRVELQALDMSIKLADEYPATKSKIVGLFDKLSDLEEKSGEEKESNEVEV